MKTIIIAEAGVNHNGDISLAKKLIDIAADAGADLVKFQTFKSSKLVTLSAPKADYQSLLTGSSESQYTMLNKLELTESMHHELIAHSHSKGIGFFSTGFDIESIDMLIRLGQERIKIPSGEITNLPLLRHVGKMNKEVILSTGMSDLGEVEKAIDILESSGTQKKKITVLHCTSAYPAPMIDINLLAMKTIQNKLQIAIGYSDHSEGIEISIAAVALGATIIEKHFTTNRNLPGPDHKTSLEPSELKSMISAIRNIESALGDGNKKLTPSESKNIIAVRRSIVAKTAIKKGELFTAENITTKRPCTGISPMDWDQVINTNAKRDFVSDEIIEL
ncbi:MAG: N-acetylneuraminate synthase [Pseudomonadota bacterium]|jgi:N,N'-diacetyllegionaminate synthase